MSSIQPFPVSSLFVFSASQKEILDYPHELVFCQKQEVAQGSYIISICLRGVKDNRYGGVTFPSLWYHCCKSLFVSWNPSKQEIGII